MTAYTDPRSGETVECIDDRHAALVADKLAAYWRWRETVERETSGSGRRHWKSADARDARIRSAYNRHEKAAAAVAEYVRQNRT